MAGWGSLTGSGGVSVISLVLDATPDEISALTGKLGKIKAVSVKAVMSKGRNS